MTVRVLIADDEPTARRRLRRMLASLPDVEILTEVEDGTAAAENIAALHPDVVFLDVQMPGLTGLEVVDQLLPRDRPLIVFTTAFDEYAVAAFESRALDYLLKPFGQERLIQTMDRVREQLPRKADGGANAAMAAVLEDVQSNSTEVRRLLSQRMTRPTRLVIRNGDRMPVIRYAEIEYAEAEGNYLVLHTQTAIHRYRGTLQSLLADMDPRVFARIHRGTVVNLDRVKEVQPWFSGDFVLVMHSGAKLRLSRTYNAVLDLLGAK